MLPLLLFTEAVARPAVRPDRPATALVRIERGVRATAEQWRQTPQAQRRELRRRDDLGRLIVIRVIENP